MLSYLCLRMLDTLGRLNMKMLKIRFSHQLMVNAVVPLSQDVTGPSQHSEFGFQLGQFLSAFLVHRAFTAQFVHIPLELKQRITTITCLPLLHSVVEHPPTQSKMDHRIHPLKWTHCVTSHSSQSRLNFCVNL